jgi:HD-GYP domain-containing protein (c-di-GMP phosphodiesterase class II)
VLHLTPEASPEVQAHLANSRSRVRSGISRRELTAESVVGGLFLVAAIAIAIGFDSDRGWPALETIVIFGSLVLATRVIFEVGAVHTYPTLVAFVPALFLLPLEWMPLFYAAALLIGKLTWTSAGLSPARSLMALGDSFFALGPVLVLLIAGSPSASEALAITLALALLSGFGGETLMSALRERLHGGADLREQMTESAWIYTVDLMFAAIGFAIALAVEVERAAVLLTLPIFGILLFLGRDRTNRMNSLLELSEAYRGTAHLLGNVIAHDDAYTGVHTRQVANLAAHVAAELGLSPSQQRKVEFGAMLHDVGKIAISKSIINKPGKLDPHEWEIMETHTLEGQRMLDQIGGLMSEIGAVVRWSHERWDGNGYPDGMAGEQIPIESRIVFCCDAYDAMTTDRPYRRAMSEEAAIAELRANAGTQFDPRVVEAVVSCLRDPGEEGDDIRPKRPVRVQPRSRNLDESTIESSSSTPDT